MGREYYGDIDGSFIEQDSDASERFGGIVYEPSYTTYLFDDEALPKVKEELKEIEKKLNEQIEKTEKEDEKKTIKELINIRKKIKKIKNLHDSPKKDGLMIARIIDAFTTKNCNLEYLNEQAYDYLMGVKIERCLVIYNCCEFKAEY